MDEIVLQRSIIYRDNIRQLLGAGEREPQLGIVIRGVAAEQRCFDLDAQVIHTPAGHHIVVQTLAVDIFACILILLLSSGNGKCRVILPVFQGRFRCGGAGTVVFGYAAGKHPGHH
ncbi:hypothetical protein D3C86_1900550 [compost metagenome]